MTLPDIMDKENAIDTKRLKTMGYNLNVCIKQALRRKGLTCGMSSCGELLHANPGNVMFCVLPITRNISIHIHQMLIQAFCRENNIVIIELGEEVNLAALIAKKMEKCRGVHVNGNPTDTSCILIQYPKQGCSRHDQVLIQFYEEVKAMSYPMPHLSLPD